MQLSTLVRATRAYSLPASVVPVLLGTTLAERGSGMGGHGAFVLASFIAVSSARCSRTSGRIF